MLVARPHEHLFQHPGLDAGYSVQWAAEVPGGLQGLSDLSGPNPQEPTFHHPTLDAGYSAQRAADAAASFDAPKEPPSKRDPHDLPDFSGSKPHSSPVLFLPPLLSSLPHGLSHTPAPSPDQPPLTTETHLPDIDPASLSLHKALHYFSPVNPQYATQPYAESFNWDSLRLPEDQEREWYVVAFRSRRRPGSDSGPLYEADRRAHEEAVQNGGLIMYWYGSPDPEGYNLATCVWQSRRHAIAANSRPNHIVAARLAVASFDVWTLERHVIKKVQGETGITVEPYTGGDVGW